MNNENFFKSLSIFLLGLLTGFLLSRIDLYVPTKSSQTANGSIKITGSQNAPILITEYSDFQCPLCQKFFQESYPTIQEKYIKTGKVRFEFKHFPLNFHAQSKAASLASECALEQNKFWEMHDLIFQNQDNWSGKNDAAEQFKKMAADLKLDTAKFNQCVDNKKYLSNVDKDYNEGVENDVRGTPTFYINDQVIVGAQPLTTFTSTIDKLLQK